MTDSRAPDAPEATTSGRRRIGLFGGSFDPPHVAHQLVCCLALSVARVDEVWLVPCFKHAFDKPLTPYEDRLAMCRLAAVPFGSRVLVSDVERSLGPVSRTAITLEHLAAHHPDTDWVLVVGSDILGETSNWYAWDRIRELAELYVVGRSGAGNSQGLELPDVSSTDVRDRLRDGQSVAGLVPATVIEHIETQGLYRARELLS